MAGPRMAGPRMAGPRMAGPLFFLAVFFSGFCIFSCRLLTWLVSLAHCLERLAHGLYSIFLALQNMGLFSIIEVNNQGVFDRVLYY